MHVLVIPSWYPQYEGDPSGSFFREQAIGLANLVNHIGVIFPNQRSLRELWNPNALPFGLSITEDRGTKLIQHNGFNLTPRWEKGISAQFLYHGLRTFKEYTRHYGMPDIIHAHSVFYGGLLAYKIAQLTGIPYIITEHATGFFKKIFNVSQLSWAKRVFLSSSTNIAVSSSLKQILQEHYKFSGSWTVLPNIVNSGFFEHNIDSYKPSHLQTRFINVALMNPIKRQDLLIDAIAICHKLGRTDLTMTIAGNGVEYNRLHQKILSLGLCEHIELAGMVAREKLPEFMASHDAFVLSSEYETFGVVIAEALALGLPCVVTKCGGPVDFVLPEDGLIVDVGDTQAIANAMIQTANHPNGIEERQKRRIRCAARFGENSVCQALVSIYSDIISY